MADGDGFLVGEVTRGKRRVRERSGGPIPGDQSGGGANPGAVGSNGTSLVTCNIVLG